MNKQVFCTIIPETNEFLHLKADGWLEDEFPFGAAKGLVSGANWLLVLGWVMPHSVCIPGVMLG